MQQFLILLDPKLSHNLSFFVAIIAFFVAITVFAQVANARHSGALLHTRDS